MRKLLFYLFLSAFFFNSCSTVDCPGTSYNLQIELGNLTPYDMEVTLLPASANVPLDLYRCSDLGGGFCETNFVLNPNIDSNSYNNRGLFTSSDTSLQAYELFNLKFKGVKITLFDEDSTVIYFSPDSTYNLIKNPFTDQSMWQTNWIDWNMPDNDCPNPVRTKEEVFYIKTADLRAF